MNVRPAARDDLPAIAALMDEFKPAGYDQPAFQRAVEFIFNDDHRDILVVDDSGDIVGMAVVNIVQELALREVRVGDVVVSAKHRGKGYGSVLMQACDSWAFERDADKVEFTSRPSREAANALYQKLGYEIRPTNVYQRKRS